MSLPRSKRLGSGAAAAMEAEYCEICSDVDGVYTADPRIVEDARRLDALSPEEMVALARSGASRTSRKSVFMFG